MCTVCGVHDLEYTRVFMCETMPYTNVAFHWNKTMILCYRVAWRLVSQSSEQTQGNFYNHSLMEPLCDVDDAMATVTATAAATAIIFAHRSSCITHATNNNRKFSDPVFIPFIQTCSNSHCSGMVSVRCKLRSADIFTQKFNSISQYLAFFSLSFRYIWIVL